MAIVTHYNVAAGGRHLSATVQGRDLGSVAREMAPIIEAARKELPRGSQLVVRGQIETMNSSFRGLLGGLVLAIVLVYLLIVVNFQSWLDPFIIISALPAALAGIVWMLFVTHTTISVPSLTGAIMCMGVATANSHPGGQLRADELARGRTRRRRGARRRLLALPPGADDGAGDDHRHGADGARAGRRRRAERAARPRGDRRPGLATVATLFFVPAVFALLHGRRPAGGAAPTFWETDMSESDESTRPSGPDSRRSSSSCWCSWAPPRPRRGASRHAQAR